MEETESWSRCQFSHHTDFVGLLVGRHAFSSRSGLCRLRRILLQFSAATTAAAAANRWIVLVKFFGGESLFADVSALRCLTLRQCSEIHLTHVLDTTDIHIYIQHILRRHFVYVCTFFFLIFFALFLVVFFDCRCSSLVFLFFCYTVDALVAYDAHEPALVIATRTSVRFDNIL